MKRLLFTLVAVLTLLGAARKAAVVKDLQGTANSLEVGKKAALAKGQSLPVGATIQFDNGSKANLVFFKDGHKEELVGPCFVRVEEEGCRLLSGKATSLVRVVNGNRQVWLASTGNTQAAGGQMIMEDQPKMRLRTAHPRTTTTQAKTAPGAPSSAIPEPAGVLPPSPSAESTGGGAAQPELDVLPGTDTVAMEWNAPRPADIELKLGNEVLQTWTMTGPGKLALNADLKLQPGQQYRVVVREPESPGSSRYIVQQAFPFRLLSDEDAKLAGNLTLLRASNFVEAVHLADAYRRLNLPAKQAEMLEAARRFKADDQVVLVTLYRLYEGPLQRKQMAAQLKPSLEKAGVKL